MPHKPTDSAKLRQELRWTSPEYRRLCEELSAEVKRLGRNPDADKQKLIHLVETLNALGNDILGSRRRKDNEATATTRRG